MYLSVSGDDHLSQMIVHGGHGLTDRIQCQVYLFLPLVAVGEKTNHSHNSLQIGRNNAHALYAVPFKGIYIVDYIMCLYIYVLTM